MMSVKSKNIHVLPTEKPSKLFYNVGGALLFTNYENHNGVNIYITSDEEIKEGDWCFYVNSIYKVLRISSNNRPIIKMSDGTFEISYYKKIILTTDQDLIKDGVQAIDDEFLEWFVKNPSCDEVEVEYNEYEMFGNKSKKWIDSHSCYEIIIPKEEPKQHVEFINNNIDQFDKAIESFKQETIGAAAEKYAKKTYRMFNETELEYPIEDFVSGAKWQQEQDKNTYSEDDISTAIAMYLENKSFSEIIKQLKNK